MVLPLRIKVELEVMAMKDGIMDGIMYLVQPLE